MSGRFVPALQAGHRRSLRGLSLASLLLGLAIGVQAAAEGKPSSVLEGTWFVIIHFQDESTTNPEAMRQP